MEDLCILLIRISQNWLVYFLWIHNLINQQLYASSVLFFLTVCHKALHPESGLPDIVPGAFLFFLKLNLFL